MTDLEDLELEFPNDPLNLHGSSSYANMPIADSEFLDYFLNDGYEGFDPLRVSEFSSESASNLSSPVHSSPQATPPHSMSTDEGGIRTNVAHSQKDNSVKVKQEQSISPNISASSSKKASESTQKKKERSKGNSQKSVVDEAKKGCFLSRDDLVKLSSRELEHYAKQLASARPLTNEEEKQLKKQRRLIKNRESAQLSRMRKKVYIEELEKKLNEITQQNESLSKQVQSINLEKKKLNDEVVYLQNIIKQSPQLTALAASGRKPFMSQNVKAAGVCLLIVLFSFGLIFNATNNGNPNKEFTRQNRREEISEVPSSSSILKGPAIVPIEEHFGTPSETEQHGLTGSKKRDRVALTEDETNQLSDEVTMELASMEYEKERETKRCRVMEEEHPLGESNSNVLNLMDATRNAFVPVDRSLVAFMMPSSLLNQQVNTPLDPSMYEITPQFLSLNLIP